MNPPQQSTTWKGLGDLQDALKGLPMDMRMRGLQAGVKALVEPVKVAAKRFAKRSEDSGALRESITTKVINYPQSGKCVGLIGPDRNYYSNGRRVRHLSLLFAKERRRPANYAHLIEFGHVIATGGKLRANGKGKASGFVPPRPFLRPAVATTMGEQSEAFVKGVGDAFNGALKKFKGGSA